MEFAWKRHGRFDRSLAISTAPADTQSSASTSSVSLPEGVTQSTTISSPESDAQSPSTPPLEDDRAHVGFDATVETPTALQDIHLSVAQQRYFASHLSKAKENRKRQVQYTDRTNGRDAWRDIVKLLMANLPEDPQSQLARTEVVRIRRAALSRSNDPKRLFLVQSLKNDCQVQFVVGPEGRENRHRYVALLGLPDAILKSKKALLAVFGHITTVEHEKVQELLSSHSSTPIRAKWGRDAFRRTKRTKKMVVDIDPPEVFSIISFANYVDDLVSSRPPGTMLWRGLHDDPDPVRNLGAHVDRVTELLVALFSTPSLEICWSACAAITALRYFERNNRIHAARRIFSRLRRVTSMRVAPVYEALLEGAAIAHDLKNFDFIARIMTDDQITPTWHTWALLVRAVKYQDFAAAEQIVQIMRTCHMLETKRAQTYVSNILIDQQLADFMAEPGSTVEDFVRKKDTELGYKKWLTVSALGSMLTYLSNRGLYGQAERVMRKFQARNGSLRSEHLEILVQNATRQGRMNVATIAIDSLLSAPGAPPLTAAIFEDLFYLAIKSRCLNVMRVVWRYACIAQDSTRPMFRALNRLIYKGRSGDDADFSASRKYLHLAATLCPGVEQDLQTEGGEYVRQKVKPVPLRKLIYEDTQRGMPFVAVTPFQRALVTAYETDLMLRRENIRDPDLVVESCVRVPVVHKSVMEAIF